jgi:hypothetical protein
VSRKLLVAPLLALSCALAATANAQTTLTRANGILGETVNYALQGDPIELFVLIPATTPGPIPVGAINPGDPRLLSVGLDLINYWHVGILNGSGAAGKGWPLPSDPNLSGVILYAQFVTITVGPLHIDDVSTPTSFVVGAHGETHLTVGTMTRDAAGHSASLLDDGEVLIAGGSTTVAGSSVITAEMELFDPQLQSFRAAVGDLITARSAHTATRLDDGRVLLLGGSDATDTILASGEIYDPATETTTPIPAMSAARAGHTATLLDDGTVFVAGGTSAFDFSDPLGALGSVHDSTEIFDPTGGGSWTAGPDLPKPRVMHAATLLADGRVLITGGIDITTIIIPVPGFTNDCRVYNPGSGGIENVPNFSGVRAIHSQLLLSDGSVLMVGGTDGNLITQVFTPLASCSRFTTNPDGWTSVASLGSARALYTTLIETGGHVYVLGGVSAVDLVNYTGTPVLEVERTPLGTISWSSAGSLLSGRMGSMIVPVDGGQRVLVTGSTGTGVDLTAEVFIP